MKTISVKQRLLNVLIENTNGYLSIEEIAKRAYGEAYMKETRKHLQGLVKRNMTHAIADGAEMGFIIIPLKEPTKDKVGKVLDTFRVLGYKIAGEDDAEDIKSVLASKAQLTNAHRQTLLEFRDSVVDERLINSNDAQLLIE